MSEKEIAEKTQAQILRDVFEGVKGRQPRSEQELKDWLASPEGREATIFEATSLSRWGETGRSEAQCDGYCVRPDEPERHTRSCFWLDCVSFSRFSPLTNYIIHKLYESLRGDLWFQLPTALSVHDGIEWAASPSRGRGKWSSGIVPRAVTLPRTFFRYSNARRKCSSATWPDGGRR